MTTQTTDGAHAMRWASVTRVWWRFVLAGAALGATVIVGSGLGIDAWFVGLFIVVVAGMSIAVGLVLAVLHLWSVMTARSGR